MFDILDRDLLLANVSLYWFTATAGSAALNGVRAGERLGHVEVEVRCAPRGAEPRARHRDPPLVERDNTVVRWTDVDRGGHFAALEEPDLLVDDLRAFVRSLRDDG